MLFNVSYRNSQNVTLQLNVSASSISNVILYCDSNNISPLNLTVVNSVEIVLNSPSSQDMYQVSLTNESGDQSFYFVYDTWNNLLTWISSQSGKSVQSLNKQNRPFVIA